MARPKKGAEDWEAGFKASINALSKGWGVSEHSGKVRLRLQFPKREGHPPNDGMTLPYTWAPASQAAVIQLVSLILEPVNRGEKGLKAAVHEVLAKSDRKQRAPDNWPSIVEAFHIELTEKRNQIQELTYQRSYGRYFKVALELLGGAKPPVTGAELLDETLGHQRYNQKPGRKFGELLKPWRALPASRQECCLAIKLLMEFAVDNRHQPDSWRIKAQEYLRLKGETVKIQTRATLNDEECVQIFNSMAKEKGEAWANVVRIQRVYGIRPWETNYLVVKPNPAAGNEDRVYVTKGKTYTSRGRKSETDPRFVEAIPVNGQDFELQDRIKAGTLELPVDDKGGQMRISGAYLGKKLRELAIWNELIDKKLRAGENLVPYSIRHTYSSKCTEMEISTANASLAMGHSEEVHRRIYRTATAKTVADSFARARDRAKAAAPCST